MSTKEKENRWIFTQEQLMNSPSIREGMTPEEELTRRRTAANTIHEMADRLNHESRARISQLCICAAMMHMHRFFCIHSFYKFDPNDIAAACLFLAGKSEECPRKLEHVVRVWWALKFPHSPNLDANHYHDAAQLMVTLENIILQSIAFDLTVDIPHPYVLTQMHTLARGNRRLSEIAYWFASDMLHMTNWGVRLPARTIACVCIQMACLWANFEVPAGSETWYLQLEPDMTHDKLLELTEEFSRIYKTYGKQLNINRYVARNSLREPQSQSSQQKRPALQPHPQATSLSSLPPPPPAPLLNPIIKTEIRNEATRKLDIHDYKQRSGATPNSSASSGAQLFMQRKNFMQPEISSSDSANKGPVDLPLPPAIANEKKAGKVDNEAERPKTRVDDQGRDLSKHRRSDKTPNSSSTLHRKRVHDRNMSSSSSAPALTFSQQCPPPAQLSHTVPSNIVTKPASQPQWHEGSSAAKKSRLSLVPPPIPPPASTMMSSAQRSSFSGATSVLSQTSQQQYRSHGISSEASHRSDSCSSESQSGTCSVSASSSATASSAYRSQRSSERGRSYRDQLPSSARSETGQEPQQQQSQQHFTGRLKLHRDQMSSSDQVGDQQIPQSFRSKTNREQPSSVSMDSADHPNVTRSKLYRDQNTCAAGESNADHQIASTRTKPLREPSSGSADATSTHLNASRVKSYREQGPNPSHTTHSGHMTSRPNQFHEQTAGNGQNVDYRTSGRSKSHREQSASSSASVGQLSVNGSYSLQPQHSNSSQSTSHHKKRAGHSQSPLSPQTWSSHHQQTSRQGMGSALCSPGNTDY
ncbi:hypothetical protein AB6A40_005215 [Gnathostoma spinigerum]|uniref:Cyclin-like domain-containing protein n=1 Tax=Gnathostoma spinigerum TaxID=75299 RepID=A0ABD6EM50_9BILA